LISDELQALADHALEVLDAAGCDMRGGGEHWRGLCPLCGNRDLSLNVDLSQRRLWLSCWHSTCSWEAVHEVLGLTRSDLRLEEVSTGGELVRRRFDQIKIRPAEFLVPDRVPLQGTTLLVGDPFAAKSTWAARLAAEVTTGVYGDPAPVAILNAEDAPAITTSPRVKAAGGNLSLVEELTVRVDEYERVLTFPDDVPKLDAWVLETGAKLLILDPLMMFITERVDSNQDHGIRRALAGLMLLAERHQIAVLICAHLNKDEQKRMLYRVGGSVGIVGLARSVLFMTHDPDDPDGEEGDLRLLAHAASNWARRAPTLRYRLEVVSWLEDGRGVTTTKLVLEGESAYSAEELIRAPRHREPSKTDLAEDAICDALQAGPRLSAEVKTEVALAVECKHATIERAASELRLAQVLGSSGHSQATLWFLLNQPPHPSPKHEEEEAGTPLRARARDGGDAQPPPPHVSEGPEEAGEAAQNGPGSPVYHARMRALVEEELRRRGKRS
jgi:hypothetical protein